MKWSWKLVRIAGIDVRVHATFLLLVVWVGLSYWQEYGTWFAVVDGVSFVLALFVCVVMHEFGHALTARHFAIATSHITLLPIGGVSFIERTPDEPKEEMIIALAGPLVSLATAGALWIWLTASGAMDPFYQAESTGGSFLHRLMLINVVLAIFNLLPALPMDGGRVFRAMLAMRTNYVDATRTAAKVGHVLALVLGFLGLLYNPFLVFIAVFIWLGASAESMTAQLKSTMSSINIEDAMLTDYTVLAPNDVLSRAVELTLAGNQKDFPVADDGSIVGSLGQTELLRGLQAHGRQGLVGDWMRRGVESASFDEPLDEVLTRCQNSQCEMLTVTRDGRVAGVASLDNLLELIRIRGALAGSKVRQ